jgi:glycosyltransferase involved in cell wall biosynthesis
MVMTVPLVTIGIISFNNDAYIGQCIESCLAQTYSNVEIVVADDASTDRSPEIIREYVERYPSKIRAVLADTNAGVAPNFNQAVIAAKGVWFKPIACDDVLMPDCIEQYMTAVNQYCIQSGILFGRMKSFGVSIRVEEVSVVPAFFGLTNPQRLKSLALMNTLSAPTAFFSLSTLKALGLANDRYPFLDDYPLWINAVKTGVFFHCVDAVTVKYRVHESLSMSVQRIGHLGYYQSVLNFSREVLWPTRRGWDRLKNIEDFVQLNRIILSIRWFKNQKTRGYRAMEVLCKPLKLYSVRLRLLRMLGVKLR